MKITELLKVLEEKQHRLNLLTETSDSLLIRADNVIKAARIVSDEMHQLLDDHENI